MRKLSTRVVASVLLLPVLLGGCTGRFSDGPRVTAGTVLRSADVAPGTAGSVALPTGRLYLTWGASAPKAPAGAETRAAPSGGRFVPLGWRWESREGLPGVVPAGTTTPLPEVVLVVGSRRYPVAEALLEDGEVVGAGTAWVAVAADAEQVKRGTVEVTFDGRTQEWHPAGGDPTGAGPESSLYGAAGNGLGRSTQSCGTVEPGPEAGGPGGPGDRGCTLEVVKTPWFGPVGWSSRDPWTVVTVQVAAGTAVGATLGGDEPLDTFTGVDPAGGAVNSRTFVFASEASGELIVRGRLDAPDSSSPFRVRWTSWLP